MYDIAVQSNPMTLKWGQRFSSKITDFVVQFQHEMDILVGEHSKIHHTFIWFGKRNMYGMANRLIKNLASYQFGTPAGTHVAQLIFLADTVI